VAKPIVDGLEKKSDVQVIRLDLLSRVGREAAKTYGIWLVPAAVMFDGSGQEIARQLGAIHWAGLTKR
jgi:hypothetical protein